MPELLQLDPTGNYQRGRMNALTIQGQEQGIAREAAQAPIRNQLNQLGLEQKQAAFKQQGQKFDQSQAIQRAKILNQTATALKGLDPSQRKQALASLAPKLQQFGFNASDFEFVDLTDEVLDQVAIETQSIIGDPSKLSNLSAGQRETRDVKTDLEGAIDPSTGRLKPREQLTAVQEMAAVKAGLISRPGSTTFKERTIKSGTGEKLVKLETDIAGGKETAKLTAQLKLKPAIQSAIAEAVNNAKSVTDTNKLNKSNELALSIYETGVGGLAESLHDTTTGPFLGYLPAISDNQQIADGAFAAMAPILKQMFRGAGEGTFTDADQRALLAMIPDRSTSAGARTAILKNIDLIVRSKLAAQEAPTTQQQQELPQGVSEDDIEATMQIHGMTRDQVLSKLGAQ